MPVRCGPRPQLFDSRFRLKFVCPPRVESGWHLKLSGLIWLRGVSCSRRSNVRFGRLMPKAYFASSHLSLLLPPDHSLLIYSRLDWSVELSPFVVAVDHRNH